MLPLSLLRTAQNHPMLVELKNGETYNGHLVSCDNWMNINLREVRFLIVYTLVYNSEVDADLIFSLRSCSALSIALANFLENDF